MKNVYPLLITSKLKECTEFYVEHFDFTIVFEQDWYIQLLHKKSGSELGFMAPNADNQPTELHPGFEGKGVVYAFEVDNAKHEYMRLAKSKDIHIIFDIKDESWGQRHFVIRDPAGVYIDIVEQL